MRIIEVNLIYVQGKGANLVEIDADEADNATEFAFKTSDGAIITEFDGCDWKDNPADILVRLTKRMKKDDELYELADGSDTLWYGILRSPRAKKSAKKKAKARKHK